MANVIDRAKKLGEKNRQQPDSTTDSSNAHSINWNLNKNIIENNEITCK